MGIFDEYDPLEELNRLRFDSSLTPELRKETEQVGQLQQDIVDAGFEPEIAGPRDSLIMEILNWTQKPQQAVVGMLDAAISGDMFTPEVGLGIERGLEERISTADLLRRAGMEDTWTRTGLGFAGDVLMDPLSYITWGQSAAMKAGATTAGGHLLSKEGTQVVGDAIKRLSSTTTAHLGDNVMVEAADKVNDAVYGARKWLDLGEELKGVQGTGNAAEEFIMKKMDDAKSLFDGVLQPQDIKQELFENTKKIRVGINLPFLGYLDIANSEAEPLFKAAGVANTLAGKMLEKVGQAADVVEQVPFVGKGFTFGKDAIDLTKKLKTSFNDIFNVKANVGEINNNARLRVISDSATAQVRARDFTLEALGEDLIKDPDRQKAVIQSFEALVDPFVKETFDTLDPAEKANLFGMVQAMGNNPALVGDVQQMFQKVFDRVKPNADIEDYIQGWMAKQTDPQLIQDFTRTKNAMEQLAAAEKDAGIHMGFLASYVPHRYVNLNKSHTSSAKRTYTSIDKAFDNSGYIADLNLNNLVESRARASYILRGRQRFAQRMIIENGIELPMLKKLHAEAIQDPQGAAAQLLRREEFGIPNFTPEQLAMIGDARDVPIQMRKDYVRFLEQFNAQVDPAFYASGVRPATYGLPKVLQGEMGDPIKPLGKPGEPIIVPHAIANLYRETVTARDHFRQLFPGEAGQRIVNGMDTLTKWSKTLVTKPWPAYWATQVVGNGFMAAMDGLHNMKPGMWKRTYDVVYKKGGITGPNGVVYDNATLKHAFKQLGITNSADDMLGTFDSLAKMDVSKLKAYESGVGALLKDGEYKLALRRAQEKFDFAFDGFFRMNHFLHRLEVGDLPQTAIEATHKAFLNYRDMTPVERSYFKRFFMFYGFTSQTTKQQLSQLLYEPAKIGMQLKLTRAFAESMSDPDALPTADEIDYRLLESLSQQEQLSAPVGRDADGQMVQARIAGAPVNTLLQSLSYQKPRVMTMGELIDSHLDSGVRTGQKILAQSNPAIAGALSLISGKNIYFDKPISEKFLRRLPDWEELAEKLAPYPDISRIPAGLLNAAQEKWLGAVPDGTGQYMIADPKAYVMMTMVAPALGRAAGFFNTLANDKLTGTQKVMRNFGGMRVEDNDPSRFYIYDLKRELKQFHLDKSIKERLEALDDD